MRWINRLLIVCGSLVALLVILVVVVLMVVDPNDYKDDVAQMVREETGRELKLEGDLKLSVFPSIALEIHDATLGNPPGFGAEPFVVIGEARFVVKVLPLLRKTLDVKRVLLSGLKVHLITDKSGKGNWEGMGSEEKPGAKAAAPSASSDGSARISGIEIRNSEVVMDDRRDGSTRRFTAVNLKTGPLGSGDPVPVELSLQLDSGSGGRPTPVAFKSPGIDLDLDGDTLDMPIFEVAYGDLTLSGSVKGRKVLADHAFDGTLKLKEASLRDTVAALSGTPLATRDPKALSHVGFEANFTLNSKKLELTSFKGRLDETALDGSLGISDLDTMALAFDLRADKLNIDSYRAPEEKPVAGKVEPPTALPLDALKALNARGTLRIGHMEFSGMTLQDVTLKLNAADGDVRLGPNQAKLYGGTYRGTVNVDARGKDAKVTLEQHLANIDFAKFLAAAYDTKRFSGRGLVNLAVAGRGRTDADIKRTLDGDLNFEVLDGAFEGHDLWFELRRARALIKREAAPEGQGSGRTKFDALKGSGQFIDGTLTTHDVLMQTPFLKSNAEGTVSLPTSAVDIKVKTKIYQVPPSGAGSEMADLKTAADIPVRVTGTLTDYKVRPDLAAAAEGEAKEKLKQKARDKLRKLLGG